jgi:hypothetical protein
MTPAEPPAGDRTFAVRALMRGAGRAALGTLIESSAGPRPYVSLVGVATALDATPLLLLSRLSDHTRNIVRDARVSLLFDGTEGFANPQEGPRVSLIGRIEPCPAENARRRFLARHPRASLYAGFADFGLFQVVGERAHWVGGFGKAAWLDRALVCPAAVVEDFAAAGERAVAEINGAADVLLDVIARRLLKRHGAGWRLVGLDPDGGDLALGSTVVRLPFLAMQASVAQARRHLAELSAKAAAK